ncbi:MAG: DUF4007 family protein [Lewinellaceae bacterium]|nr:DUF4007 family protein [Lewinellaceae bacterium]
MESIYDALKFSGHETFQCRHLWLKKGYDYVLQGKSFNADDAVLELGVGKNMTSSIRHWMRAFNILEDGDELTNFAHWLFSETGKDPYLEDDASLWLLHYNLVSKGYATSYSLIFNVLRKERIEFNKDSFIKFVQNKFDTPISTNSIGNDFEVFLKLYVGTESSKDNEDVVAGILPDLRLVRVIHRDKQPTLYHIETNEREDLPEEVLLYGIITNPSIGLSISLDSLERDYNSVGSIFAINRTGLVQKIENLCNRYDFLVYKDDAGIRELQFKYKPEDPYEILNDYYGH